MAEAVGRLGAGASVLVEITGEPGIGKTRLLDELVKLADAADATVLAGRCAEYERQTPFSAFAGAIDVSVNPAHPDGAPPGLPAASPTAAEPTDGGAGPTPVTLPGLERVRVHRLMARRLAQAAAGSPLVVVLDDLHWADNGSLELLRYVLRGRSGTPLLLAVAYRPQQADERLVTALAETAPEFHRERMPLQALSADEIRTLVEAAGVACPPGLHARSEGNPLYAQALVAVGASADTSFTEGRDRSGDVTLAVSQVLLAEIQSLEPEETAVLRTAAVAGDPFDPEFVVCLARDEVTDAPAALARLRRRDLVRPEPTGPGLLRFRHPVLRSTVYQHAGPGWLLAAHMRAAAALSERGAPPTVLAPHVARFARPGDRPAAQVLVRAARSVLTSVPASAAHWLGRALTVLPAGDTAERGELSLLLAHACAAAGDLDRGREILHGLMAALPAEGEHRLRTVRLLSLVNRVQGRYQEGAAVLDAPSRASSPDAAASLALRAACEVLACDPQALGHAREAVRRCRDGQAAATRALCLGTRALVEACRGSIPWALASAASAGRLLAGMSDEEVAPLLDCLGQLGWAQVLLENPGRANVHFARGVKAAERTGQSHLSTYLLIGQSLALLREGDVPDALRACDEAEERSRLLRSDTMLALTLAMRAAARIWRSGPAAAAPIALSATRLGGRSGRNWWDEVAWRILARVRLLEGDGEDAIRILLRTGGGQGLPRVDVCTRPMWLAALAEGELLCGRAAVATALLDSALCEPAAARLPAQRAHVLAAMAHAQLVGGYPAQAASTALRAAATFRRSGQPLDEGRCRLLVAAGRRAVGQPEAAQAELAKAWSIGRSCGAHWLRDQAAYHSGQLAAPPPDAAHAAGHRTGRSPATGAAEPRRAGRPAAATRPAALTPREREVVVLVQDGLTNGEAADRLHVTVKAVEAHLTRAYRKLGVATRAELAAMLPYERPDPASEPVWTAPSATSAEGSAQSARTKDDRQVTPSFR